MSLRYNLQFFAEGPGGEKTEPATAKKLSDARDKGQVAKSREIANGFGLLAMFLIIRFWIGNVGIQFIEVFATAYNKMPEVVTFWEGDMPQKEMRLWFQNFMLQTIIILAPMFIVAVLVAFLCEVAQVQLKITPKTLEPKLSKLNPLSGFKRMFSVDAIVELIKSIAKLAIIGIMAYNYVKDKSDVLFSLYDIPLMQVVQIMGEMISDMGVQISVVYIVFALVDFGYHKFKFNKDMMMTKQEVKDEYKQQEGDPQIKGKIRQKMQEASRRRMMQELPTADVVITNPTHYAVAIKYDPEKASAPIVLAKGSDYLAAKIKEIAKEHHIEIVENKPLARMLFANVEIGEAVPPELYQAVAEVLAFVYRVQGKI